MAQILVIEDNTTMREGILQILARSGYDVKGASGGREGVESYEKALPDFVITDLKMEDMDGMDVLREIRKLSPEALIMIITAFGTIETAVEAMKMGAYDFITKPFSPDLLRMKTAAAVEVARMRAENRFLRSEVSRGTAADLIGESAPFRKMIDHVERAAPTDTTVLILGESGTGKELVARAIHARSRRSDKPFIKVDCAALAEGVLESELFGHERGAFTGATHRKLGRFELADGGTIFLDEIGEVPAPVQLKLLRVLQDRSFERVGGTRTISVDVRVVSATNKDLEKEIRSGRFREDLYYRLHIVPIVVPPLRSRVEDIPLLVRHFLYKLGRRHGRTLRVTEEALDLLKTHNWPGNIRELENLLERIAVLGTGDTLGAEDMPGNLRKRFDSEDIGACASGFPLNEALEELEKRLILRAYSEAGGVKARAAQLLGIKPGALYYKLEKYGIHSKDGS